MASNNIKIIFWLHKAKLNKRKQAPIYFRITYNYQRRNISTGQFIEPERWDNTKYRAKGLQDDAKEINGYIQQTKSKLISLYNEMLKTGEIDLDKLVNQFFGRDEDVNQMTILDLIRFHNADFEKRIGIDYSYSTFEKYDILRKKVEAFIPKKYGKKDMKLKDVTHSFAADFDYYLKTNDKNQHNTVVKYIINLKKIFNVAVINGWITKSPFITFKSTYKDVDRVYLSQKEIDKIRDKKFKLKRLDIVRDLFLFQCYTGFSYSDMAKLSSKDISAGIDGNKWIIIRRKKTDVRSAVPLLDQALVIIDKYAESGDGALLPCYAIQKFNSYLHEIAELCGIDRNLTSHVGRRTFATTIALANGVSISTISKILGHSNTRITEQYAQTTDMKISEEMNRLKKVL